MLAAGRSSRMRSGHKLLADLGGEAVIRRTVELIALSPSIGSVTVVLGGDRANAVRDAIGRSRARTVLRPDGDPDLSASLRAGLAAVEEADGVLVALGDMPLVRPDTIGLLVERFAGALGSGVAAPVVRPVHGEAAGHPVLWHWSHRPALSCLTGDRGGGALLASLGASVVPLPTDDRGTVLDIDTDEALEEARRLVPRGESRSGDPT